VLPPEGFVVDGVSGPLAPGELDRAGRWARAAVRAAADLPPRPGLAGPGLAGTA
jgi:hypothetical protein